jgi:hypothetical protein
LISPSTASPFRRPRPIVNRLRSGRHRRRGDPTSIAELDDDPAAVLRVLAAKHVTPRDQRVDELAECLFRHTEPSHDLLHRLASRIEQREHEAGTAREIDDASSGQLSVDPPLVAASSGAHQLGNRSLVSVSATRRHAMRI